MTNVEPGDDDSDPGVVDAARALAERARHDGISLIVLLQAATRRRRPDFAAALAVAVERGWLGADLDYDQRADIIDQAIASAARSGW